MDIVKKTKINYRVTYLEMNEVPKFDWPKNLKHKLSIFLAEDFPSWYFLFFYKQVGEKYCISWDEHLNKYDGLKTHEKLNMFSTTSFV